MIEILKEVKELIEAGKLEEAKALIDEVIEATPAEASAKESENAKKDDDYPLPGQGNNGHI